MAAKVNPPRCVSRTEVTIVMEITALDAAYDYQLQFKEPHEDWVNSSVVPAKGAKVTLDELNPSCSYHIRVMAKKRDLPESEWIYSEEVAVDTEVPGCTPSPACSCTIQ
ncbi:unnamed protein product [Aphanomyces euteiches]|uniref:Fibronectin type-III domain-containing protein n=1 Tax=Aphanomyces euteiches TaxID=100861 RepID=A0A6G0XWX2_9STRA|nr:hypothetical protein Ae201684_000570 [Aphanomyces euteiches]KAH9091861.1 hypothetical protein Ae201684P_011404 [Aphanomyces euteiches]KAH9127945.1 hypothetical protein AeMF1_001824 [Aphanomyces euteiches]KAH9130378.1 hypothetical protein LEN26_008589 [Aphanomyces euteiches]KAH9140916.1 hypothetical protein AeRB84_014883 [Aphanomyces euteiches]